MNIIDFIKKYNGANPILNTVKNEYYRNGVISKSKMAIVKAQIEGEIEVHKKDRVYTMAPIQIKKNTEIILKWKGKHSVVDMAIDMYKRTGRITESMMNKALTIIGDAKENKLKESINFNKEGVRLTPTQYRSLKKIYDLSEDPKIVTVNSVTHIGENTVCAECDYDGITMEVFFTKKSFTQKVGSITF
jgi:hypothetical protein